MPLPDLATRERLIAEALRARADEVTEHLLPGAEAAPAEPADDAEEALRVVMVRLWPALSSPEALRRLVDALQGLHEAARGEDWRFLDAWNNAYETVVADPSLARDAAAQELLTTYADLLAHHVARLTR